MIFPSFHLFLSSSMINLRFCNCPFKNVFLSFLHGCTTWTQTKRMEINLDENCARMQLAVLKKSQKQLYCHLPPILQTIHVRRIRHAGYCWESEDELISDILQRKPTDGFTSDDQQTTTCIHQLCVDTGFFLD